MWSTSLEVVIDPPPQSVSCLRRHRLSSGGGGTWITIEHDAVVLGEEHVVVTVRRGPAVGKDKHLLTVNGSKVRVDVEDLPETEVRKLAKMKRVQPTRIPLDQPPALGVSRRRERSVEPPPTPTTPDMSHSFRPSSPPVSSSLASVTSHFTAPLTRLFYSASDAPAPVSTVLPPTSPTTPPPAPTSPPTPAQAALDALDSLRLLHSQTRDTGSWILVSDKDGLLVQKRTFPTVSTAHPVHRASRVFQGCTPEEVIGAVAATSTRKAWDDRIDSVVPLEVYAGGVTAAFVTASCAFPFRDRGFYLASLTAKAEGDFSSSGGPGTPTTGATTTTIFHVSTSFPADSASAFDSAKVNPYVLPIGSQIIEGWVLSTLR